MEGLAVEGEGREQGGCGGERAAVCLLLADGWPYRCGVLPGVTAGGSMRNVGRGLGESKLTAMARGAAALVALRVCGWHGEHGVESHQCMAQGMGSGGLS